MPQVFDQDVACSGIVTLPSSDSAAKALSASRTES